MKAVIYFRTKGNAKADVDLTQQRETVASWLAETGAEVVGEFVETETGRNARPTFGRARRAALECDATLVVATTKAFGGSAFTPTSGFGERPAILCLRDAEEIAREAWKRSPLLVCYLRSASGEETASSSTLAKQRERLADLIVPAVHTVLGEFIEDERRDEATSAVRPALAAALDLCRQHKARLLIGTTDAIGSGAAFLPEFRDVPYEVAYRQQDEWPAIIKISDNPFAVGLHFGDHLVRNCVPVYVVNATGGDFAEVIVESIGTTMMDDEVLKTSLSQKLLGRIPAGHGCLLEGYDLFFDSDFTTEYEVTARTPDGSIFQGTAATNGRPTSRWLPISDWAQLSASRA
ncbi:hypothetical protein ABLE91_26740 [Aquabacter sp. CN5-332]|uniref:hypothetical protein n=1 Tax=Aquabacter sp. CN5-332 TaxID=3156608 RepID=UPI0032B5374D